ncbi:MAG: hypothetical protein CEE42_06215 [Promethearchaeota archaeon Loki_b31]|nr:MAG: hypothetical protein CEE42_06215 [Candidatus Lokiarchaeota archaeon Loki_b31]
MTNVNEEVFLNKLYDVVYKLSTIAKTQSYRFKKEWDENLDSLKEKPHLVRQIPVKKEKFLTDIEYRIKILNTVKLTFEDGVHSIKSLLNALYSSYFNDSDIFTSSFTEQDQITLKYLVAKEILGNLIQYNQLDHKSVPLKYNILARTYLLIKFKGQRDTEILENLKKINIKLKLSKLKKIMEEIISDGFINKTKKGRYLYYHLQQELDLSEEGKKTFNQTIRPLVDWPTLFYRSYYNVRELNVTVDGDCKYPDYLNKVLLKAATQGYLACHYIFNNLVRYYEKLKEV